jgi:hypothetical protein
VLRQGPWSLSFHGGLGFRADSHVCGTQDTPDMRRPVRELEAWFKCTTSRVDERPTPVGSRTSAPQICLPERTAPDGGVVGRDGEGEAPPLHPLLLLRQGQRSSSEVGGWPRRIHLRSMHRALSGGSRRGSGNQVKTGAAPTGTPDQDGLCPSAQSPSQTLGACSRAGCWPLDRSSNGPSLDLTVAV